MQETAKLAPLSISVVSPAYNEEAIIEKTVLIANEVFSPTAERFDYICLDLYDGIELTRPALVPTFVKSPFRRGRGLVFLTDRCKIDLWD